MIDHVSRSRRRIKSVVATALCRTGATSALDAVRRRSTPLVLGYHRVVANFEREARRAMPAMLVSTAMLERHLDWIGRSHEFASLDDIGRSIDGATQPRRPLAAVTFDDGYRDVYEEAFPLLKRKGIPAAVFVVSDLVGTDALQLHDELYLLLGQALTRWPASATEIVRRLSSSGSIAPRKVGRIARMTGDAAGLTLMLLRAMPRDDVRSLVETLRVDVGPLENTDRGLLPLDWPMLREMRASGVTIGSHTRTHTLLRKEGRDRQIKETSESKRTLESHLGAPVAHFAYPDGSFNPSAVRAVAAAGYEFAYTTCAHRDALHPELTVPRCLLWEKSSVDASGQFSPDILDCQTRGVLMGARPCTPQSHQ